MHGDDGNVRKDGNGGKDGNVGNDDAYNGNAGRNGNAHKDDIISLWMVMLARVVGWSNVSVPRMW